MSSLLSSCLHSFVYTTRGRLLVKSPPVASLLLDVMTPLCLHYDLFLSSTVLSSAPILHVLSFTGHRLQALPPFPTSKYQVGLYPGLSSLSILFHGFTGWWYGNNFGTFISSLNLFSLNLNVHCLDVTQACPKELLSFFPSRSRPPLFFLVNK